MRALAGCLLSLVLAASGGVLAGPASAQQADEPSVEGVLAEVAPYQSTWATLPRDIASLTSFTDTLRTTQRQYRAWSSVLSPQLDLLRAEVAGLTQALADQKSDEAALAAALAAETGRQQIQEREVGSWARLLYQQPSPDLTAVAQMMEGEDLRAFERQNLVTNVLASNAAELERIIAKVEALTSQLAHKRVEIEETTGRLTGTTAERDAVAAKQAVVDSGLNAIAADLDSAAGEIDRIKKAEEARIRAAAAAAAKAEARARAEAAAREQAAKAAAGSVGTAQPTGGGVPARGSGDFSARLPASIPYRDTFLTYGLRYRVEPALLAAIAAQESGFNAWAGCDRAGGGKGLMQHEGQSKYCGPAAVPASVETSAIMLARYYNSSGSWNAAVFAYNNGPGLMDEWVRYSGDRNRLLSVLATHYNAQPYASPGPKAGYPTWGAWRAAVAYSYASPQPLPGFRSATQTWLIYRQG